ncbi:hypothetical protein T265_15864, partial [Opisthorchis viverrini]
MRLKIRHLINGSVAASNRFTSQSGSDMATNKLMYLSFLLPMLMGLLRSSQSCEPIPAENQFRGRRDLGGLRWEMRGLGALVHTRWYNGVEVEFCKDACKSQPNCFGFNWW